MALSLLIDNPYRVFGITTAASKEAVQNAYQSMMANVLKGQEVHLGQDMTAYLKEPLRTPYRLDMCKSELSSRKGRLQHAVYWFIDTSPIDHAALFYLVKGNKDRFLQILESTPAFSSYINLAVFALLEDRFDDAITYYEHCFYDKALTADFMKAVTASDQPVDIRGEEILYKINEVIDKARRNKEKLDASDERSVVGAGAGVANKESQRKRLLERQIDKAPSISMSLSLRQQANKFDRHLSEALEGLQQKLEEIDSTYAITASKTSAHLELAVSPAAGLALEALSHFLKLNGSLIASFRQHCEQAGTRRLYMEYIYDLASMVNTCYHTYMMEISRQCSPAVLQKIRSITLNIERLVFRYKDTDLEYLVASMKRVEDVLPYLREVSRLFEQKVSQCEGKNIVKKYYEFHAESVHLCDRFLKQYSDSPAYSDSCLHVQDIVVRFNVGFINNMAELALRKKFVLPALEQQHQEQMQDNRAESQEKKQKKKEKEPEQKDKTTATASSEIEKIYTYNQQKAKASLQKQQHVYQQVQKRRSLALRKLLGPEKRNLQQILDKLALYSLSHEAMEVIAEVKHTLTKVPSRWSSVRTITFLLCMSAILGGVLYAKTIGGL